MYKFTIITKLWHIIVSNIKVYEHSKAFKHKGQTQLWWKTSTASLCTGRVMFTRRTLTLKKYWHSDKYQLPITIWGKIVVDAYTHQPYFPPSNSNTKWKSINSDRILHKVSDKCCRNNGCQLLHEDNEICTWWQPHFGIPIMKGERPCFAVVHGGQLPHCYQEGWHTSYRDVLQYVPWELSFKLTIQNADMCVK